MQWEENGIRIGSRVLTNSGSGNVYFTAGSDSVKMFINGSNGNVGIGTTSPGQKLDVAGIIRSTSTNPQLRIHTSSGTGTGYLVFGDSADDDIGQVYYSHANNEMGFVVNAGTKMIVKSTGYVGVGTTSPAEKLEVQGNIRAERIIADGGGALFRKQVDAWASGAQTHDILYNGWTSSTGDYTYLKAAGNGTTAHGILQVGDLGTWIGQTDLEQGALADSNTDPIDTVFAFFRGDKSYIKGSLGIGTNNPSFASGSGLEIEQAGIATLRLQNTSSGKSVEITQDSDFKIESMNSGADILLMPTANVGIGTATPDHKLEISSDMGSSPTGVVFLRKTGTNAVGGGGAIRFDTSASNDDHTLHYASVEGVRSSSDNGSNTLLFKTSKVGVNSNAPTTKMVIDEDGRVGIGTDTPNNTCSLEVYRNDGSNSVVRIHEDAGNDAARLHLRSGGNDAYIQLPNTSSAFEIRTENNLVSGSAALTLQSSGRADFGYAVRIEEYQIDTTETSTTATTQVAIHSFAAATFRSARFTVQVTNSTDSTYHTTELLLVHDGTTANITEFGEIHTGSAVEATFDADVNGGNVRLLATPASTDSMAFKVVAHAITT